MFEANKAEQLFKKTMSLYSTDPETIIGANFKKRDPDDTVKMLRCMGRVGISYFIGVTVLIFSCTFTTMPVVYQYDITLLRYRQGLSIFIMLEVIINFYLTCTVKNFFEPVKNIAHGRVYPNPEWKRCTDCEHYMPPRTHHCSLCQKCVLKRDHHCFFTGTCVGYENQRYFIVFCFYCACAAIYGVYVNYHFLVLKYGPISFTSVLHCLLPIAIVEWIFGYADISFLFCAFLNNVCAVTATGTTGIFIWQLFIALWGTTTFELFKGIKPFRKGVFGPVRSVFGSYWMINFIIPLTFCRQHGDGIHWEPTKTV